MEEASMIIFRSQWRTGVQLICGPVYLEFRMRQLLATYCFLRSPLVYMRVIQFGLERALLVFLQSCRQVLEQLSTQ
jgi:hypothetical protein